MQLPITALTYFLLAAYMAGVASAVAVFALILSGRDGQRRSGCFFQSMIFGCLLLAAYLAYAGATVVGY